MNKHSKIQGFTLIELMIVVAIIGILAAIALPAYSDYQAQSKATAGLAEISGAKTKFSLVRNDGISISSPSDIGLSDTGTNNCDFTVTDVDITCELINAPTQVDGKRIVISRPTTTSKWECDASDIPDAALRPSGCK